MNLVKSFPYCTRHFVTTSTYSNSETSSSSFVLLQVNQIKLGTLLSLTHLYVQIVCTRNLHENNVWHVTYDIGKI